jgi:hypothetical protein
MVWWSQIISAWLLVWWSQNISTWLLVWLSKNIFSGSWSGGVKYFHLAPGLVESNISTWLLVWWSKNIFYLAPGLAESKCFYLAPCLV